MNSPFERIERLGFKKVGSWTLFENVLTFNLTDQANSKNVLYAFLFKQEVLYIGETTRSLAKRMSGYQKPGSSQRTNIRVKKCMLELLSKSPSIDIYALPDIGLLNYGGFHINLAAGLEDSLIAIIKPEWNLSGKVRTASKPNAIPSQKNFPKKVNQPISNPHDSLANKIRQYTYETYIEPKLSSGEEVVTVRAGDIHNEMNLDARLPAVCSALGSNVFCRQFGLIRISRNGPGQGANVFFEFSKAR